MQRLDQDPRPRRMVAENPDAGLDGARQRRGQHEVDGGVAQREAGGRDLLVAAHGQRRIEQHRIDPGRLECGVEGRFAVADA